MMGAYLEFDGSELHFDAVTSEATEGTAGVTEHPVEEGADVADHVRDELDTVTLEVVVTNQPIKDVNNLYGLDLNYTESLEVETTEPVIGAKKLDIPKYRPFPVTPGALLQTISNAVTDLLSDDTVAQVYGQTEPKTLLAGAQIQNWPTKFNAITDTEALLSKWKQEGVVGQVITPWKTFPSVVIVRVSTLRDATIGDAAKISLTLREIRFVESKQVTAPVPTEARGKTQKAKGRQPTSVVKEPADKKKSVLSKVTQ